MEQLSITIPVEARSHDELDPNDRILVAKATEAASKAYAPYSKFHVGAAILLADGNIVAGSNQENAAFPSGTCAERTAAYYAHSSHSDTPFDTIAIAACHADGEVPPAPISPCGACRQALLEYETLFGKNIRVILAGRDKVYILPSVKSLLPLAFSEF